MRLGTNFCSVDLPHQNHSAQKVSNKTSLNKRVIEHFAAIFPDFGKKKLFLRFSFDNTDFSIEAEFYLNAVKFRTQDPPLSLSLHLA